MKYHYYYTSMERWLQHHKEIKPKKFEVGLSYFENVNIPERFSLDYLSDFIGQVQKFKSLKSSKDVKRSYLETKVSMFTKYPYLYNSLRKHNKALYPVVVNYDQHTLSSGTGRLLLMTKYFPDMKIDLVLNDHKNPQYRNYEKFIEERILPKWDLDDTYSCYSDFFTGESSVPYKTNTLCGFEFAKEGYEKTFPTKTSTQKIPYARVISSDYAMWERVHSILMESNPMTLVQYDELLDRIIFDNIEYVDSTQVEDLLKT